MGRRRDGRHQSRPRRKDEYGGVGKPQKSHVHLKRHMDSVGSSPENRTHRMKHRRVCHSPSHSDEEAQERSESDESYSESSSQYESSESSESLYEEDMGKSVRRRRRQVSGKKLNFETEASHTPVSRSHRKHKRSGKERIDTRAYMPKNLGGKRGRKQQYAPDVVVKRKDVWDLDSDGDDRRPLNAGRFAACIVKKKDCYYRSNLQTTVKELKQLKFSAEHLRHLKHTPFWFLLKSILETDGSILHERVKKNEEDIRSIVKVFDAEVAGFSIGNRVAKLDKRDVVLIFGVRDGSVAVNVTRDFDVTPWMMRCFKDCLKDKGIRNCPQLKKAFLYERLNRVVGMDDKAHGQDVARLVHCYLLSSLFLPSTSTTLSWSVLSFVEEFEEICRFDWSSLIVDVLVKQLVATETMKLAGCAMLLPYWLCEHIKPITPEEGCFPRYLCWDLNQLHKKLLVKGFDQLCLEAEFVPFLKPTLPEKEQFRVLIEECIQYTGLEIGITQVDETQRSPTAQNEIVTGPGERKTIGAVENAVSYSPGGDLNNGEDFCDLNDDLDGSHLERPCFVMNNFTPQKPLTDSVVGRPVLNASVVTPRRDLKTKHDSNWCDDIPNFDLGFGSYNLPCNNQTPSQIPRSVSGVDSTTGGVLIGKSELEKRLEDENKLLHETIRKLLGETKFVDDAATDLVQHTKPDEKDRGISNGSENVKEREKVPNAPLVVESDVVYDDNNVLEVECDNQDNVCDDILEREVEHVIVENNNEVTNMQQDPTTGGEALIHGPLNEIDTLKSKVATLTADYEEMDREALQADEDRSIFVDALIQTVVQVSVLNVYHEAGLCDINGECSDYVKSMECKIESLEQRKKELELTIQCNQAITNELKESALDVRAIWSEEKGNLMAQISDLATQNLTLVEENKAMDSKIQQLEKDNMDLAVRVASFTTPSLTQILENPERIKYVDLLEQHSLLQKKCDSLTQFLEASSNSLAEDAMKIQKLEQMLMQAGIQSPHQQGQCSGVKITEASETTISDFRGERTPVENDKQVIKFREFSPGTVARAVKARTRDATRRPKPLSPLCVSHEVHEVGDDDDTDPPLRVMFRWDRKSDAVKKTSERVQEVIRACIEDSDDGLIWEGRGPFASVSGDDMLKILHHEAYTSGIIDSWGELLLSYTKEIGKERSTVIFPSLLWKVVSTNNAWNTLRGVVNKLLVQSVDTDILIFPLNTPSGHPDRDGNGFHWTMLKYYVRAGAWTFYNSFKPRGNNEDKYFEDAKLVICYVESQLKCLMTKAGKNNPLTRGDGPLPSQAKTPQQVSNSLDCGVVVCHVMEKIIKRDAVTQINTTAGGVYASSTATNYRVRMVSSFCCPDRMT